MSSTSRSTRAIAHDGARQQRRERVEVARAAHPQPGLLAHLRDQLAAGALGDEAAFVDDADAVAQPLGLLHVVRGVEHRQAAAAQRLDALEDGVAALRVDADGRLVEHQQLGLVQQTGGDVATPLHAARVALDPLVGPIGEADEVEHLVDPHGEAAPRPGPGAGRRSGGSRARSGRGRARCPGGPGRWRASASVDDGVIGRPATATSPPSGASSPHSIEIVVVLPAPFGPSRP